ncbi:hypothetical protein ABT187_32065 [Streptomyces sp. NPDC001817]|uniref:hypothetical protein n=1 Tax=Streptomyces sp. NPDC001817 TaxID=3154398 RepID=UPI00331CD6D3
MAEDDQAGGGRTPGERPYGVLGAGLHRGVPVQQAGLRCEQLGRFAASHDERMGHGREGLDEDESVVRGADVPARPAAEELTGTFDGL